MCCQVSINVTVTSRITDLNAVGEIFEGFLEWVSTDKVRFFNFRFIVSEHVRGLHSCLFAQVLAKSIKNRLRFIRDTEIIIKITIESRYIQLVQKSSFDRLLNGLKQAKHFQLFIKFKGKLWDASENMIANILAENKPHFRCLQFSDERSNAFSFKSKKWDFTECVDCKWCAQCEFCRYEACSYLVFD